MRMNIRILLPVIAGFLLTVFLLAVYGGVISRKGIALINLQNNLKKSIYFIASSS